MYDNQLTRAKRLLATTEAGFNTETTGLCSPCQFYDMGDVQGADGEDTPARWVMFREWPEFGGNYTYPVPASSDFKGDDKSEVPLCEQQYDSWTGGCDMYSGEYGAARIRLLKHCIEWMEARQ